ncbi:MAG: hypothetical protein IPL69_20965 [Saprospiraceae bacterium]|nr:hypothetical protein [Candidatus Brachybacter algidus]
MYANRKEWDLQKVTIRLNLEKLIADGVEKTIIYKDISLEGNLDDVQKSRLLLIYSFNNLFPWLTRCL